jgi:hypothetical protein
MQRTRNGYLGTRVPSFVFARLSTPDRRFAQRRHLLTRRSGEDRRKGSAYMTPERRRKVADRRAGIERRVQIV